jgi:hypothetical protein
MVRRTKSVPVRLPEDLYNAVRNLSAETGDSMNQLIVESIAEKLKVKERQALYDSFTLLGSDAEADVEFAFEAQHEALGD